MADDTKTEPLPVVANGGLLEAEHLAQAERRLSLVQKTLALSLQVTTKNDWVNLDGQPYLLGSGAEKLIKLFGVCITGVRSQKIRHEGSGHYTWVYTGRATLGAIEVDVEGRCSSKKPFFSRYTDEVNGERIKRERPVDDIDETNIMADAMSDLYRNAVSRLLGLRGLTWEQLKAAGFNDTDVAGVSYDKGKGGRVIRAKYAGKCTACGGAYEVGAEIWYVGPKKVYHNTDGCRPKAETTENPGDKASELREVAK